MAVSTIGSLNKSEIYSGFTALKILVVVFLVVKPCSHVLEYDNFGGLRWLLSSRKKDCSVETDIAIGQVA
jgi:hypothetical protein